MLYKCIIFALQNGIIMNSTSITRKQTSFRLSENLLKRLQIEAKKHNRSLNNLVESVLLAFVSEKPNKTTLAAMKEAETSDNLETLDLPNFRNFVDSSSTDGQLSRTHGMPCGKRHTTDMVG